MDKRHFIKNIRSSQIIDGSPKLPTAEQIEHGEIAINFAQGHETLSLKNDNDEIVPFEIRSVIKLNDKLDNEIERATAKEDDISTLLGSKIDTKDDDTVFGRIAKEISDRTNAIELLDATVGSTTIAEGKHIAVQVIEEDGKLTDLTVSENDIASNQALEDEVERAIQIENEISNRLGNTSDDKTKETAFGYIAKEADARATAITMAINDLDSSIYATAAEDNKYSVLTGIVETDGKLTNKTEVKLASVAFTGKAEDVFNNVINADDTHVAIIGTNIKDQITSISSTLKVIESNASKYKVVALTSEEIGQLPDGANVKEGYKVISYTNDWNTATDKQQVGETIKIYKDSSLKSADFVTSRPGKEGEEPTVYGNFLKLVYIKADGNEDTVYVDMSTIITEAEVKNGIAVDSTDNKLYVKRDSDCESFLTIGENGVKLSGVQNAINTAIDNLDVDETTIGGTTDGKHISLTYSETDGKVSLSVDEADIASKQGLENEINRATNVENDIKDTYLKNINVNGIDGTFEENVASVTVQGKDIEITDSYTAVEYPSEFEGKVQSYHIVKNDKIDSAFNKVENTFKVLSEEVITNELTNANAINNLADATGIVANDDSIGYVQYQKAHYINDALSIHHATMLLDDALSEVANSLENVGNVDDVKVNGKSVVSDKVAKIIMDATTIPLTGNQGETSTIFTELSAIKETVSGGADSIETKINALKSNLEGEVSNLTNKIIEDELVSANNIIALADASGLTTIGNEIKYVKKAKPYYIAEAETLADAINLLDDRIRLVEQSIDTKIKKAIYDLVKANPTLVNPYEINA